MTDVTTKAVLHLGASSGFMQELGNRLSGHESSPDQSDDSLPEAAQQAKREMGATDSSGSESGYDGKEKRETFYFTVMIAAKSGESRALSIKAASPDEAKNAARSTLDDGEEVVSVSQSTVPAPPDPNRGQLA